MKPDSEFRTICEAAVKKWGLDAQLLQVQEEAAELIVAISHFRRGRRHSKKEVLEEPLTWKLCWHRCGPPWAMMQSTL